MTTRKPLSPTALVWFARQLWWRTGPLLLAGPCLLLCCALFAYGALRPLAERTEAAQRQLAALRGQPVGASRAVESADVRSLTLFYGGMPQTETAYDLIERVYAAAASQHLALDQAEYKLVHEKDGKLSRITMALPVKGSYPQVRKFIAQAMRELPSLALDGITFQRQRIDEAAVEAQVRLTIYVRQS